MNGRSGAAEYRHKLLFEKRTNDTDDFGDPSATYTSEFSRYCALTHLGGSEGVEAARLAGREVYRLQVRSSPAVKQVTTADWRLSTPDGAKTYNILSIDMVTSRAFVWMRVEA